MSSFTPTRNQQSSYDSRPPDYLTEKYEFGQRLGGGAFGDVWLAYTKGTSATTTAATTAAPPAPRKTVAIKHIKRQYNRWEDCLKLRECRALSKLPAHKNCVKLFQLIHEHNELFFVFEYCPMDLHQLTMARRNERKPFTNHEVLTLVYELLSALHHLHRHGFFHRDIKPENLLVMEATTSKTIGTLKLADFGQTREIRSRPPFTDYVATRWYRAPEVLDGSGQYNSPVDIWAAGCVLGELICCGTPIFPGQSVLQQMDMVQKARHPDRIGLGETDAWEPTHVQSESSTPATMHLLRTLLSYDQRQRPNATTALRMTIFDAWRLQEEQEEQHKERIKEQTAEAAEAAKAAQAAAGTMTGVTGVTGVTAVGSNSVVNAQAASTLIDKENTLTTPTKSKRVSQLLKEAGFTTPPDNNSSNGANSSTRMLRSNSEHVLRQAFSKYDQQNTGFIDAKAVSKILVKLGDFEKPSGDSEGDSMSLMAAEAEVALADTSARGVLSYEDFKEWFSERAAVASSVGCENTSARVAAARQLLVQSWDSPSPSRPKKTLPRSNSSKLRPHPPTSPTSATSATSATSPQKSMSPEKASTSSSSTSASASSSSCSTVPGTGEITSLDTTAAVENVADVDGGCGSPKRTLFDRFDVEQTGYLDKTRFGKLMEHMGLVTSPDNEDDILVEAEMAMLADEEGNVKYKDWRQWFSEQ